MTKEESNWVISRAQTLGQIHRMRKSGWPAGCFVGLQLSDQEEGVWQVWKIEQTTGSQKTSDLLVTLEEIIHELEMATSAWREDGDELGAWAFEAEVLATMIAELMGNLVIDAGQRIIEASRIATGRANAGPSDLLVAAQMAWHRAAQLQPSIS